MTSLGIALIVGLLFAFGAYLFMHRNSIRVIVGLMLISNGANLAILAMSREPSARLPPVVAKESSGKATADRLTEAAAALAEQPFVDPLPQALILTAIVIGFGVMALFIALVYCSYAEEDTVLLHQLDPTEMPGMTDEESAPRRHLVGVSFGGEPIDDWSDRGGEDDSLG